MNPFPVRGMLNNPAFLALGAASLLVVLAYLYMGGWRYITGSILAIVNLALGLAVFFTGFLAVIEFAGCFEGTPPLRSVHMTWGLILTASTILTTFYIGLVNDDSNPLGRFLKRLKPAEYE